MRWIILLRLWNSYDDSVIENFIWKDVKIYVGMNCLLWWMEISVMRIWVMHGMTCETVVFFLVESVILFILILVM